MPILLALLTFFSFQYGFAAGSSALSFYRSQQSLFPSGQALLSDLEKNVIRREFSPWFRIAWNKKEFEVPGQALLKDLHTTKTLTSKHSSEALKSPLMGSAVAFKIQANSQVVVLKTDSYWAEIFEPQQKKRGWVALHQFTAPNEDLGVFVTLTDSFLQKKPHGSTEIITTIPPGTRLIPLSLEKNYFKAQYKGHTGYVDLSTIVSRADFAMWAYHKSKGWLGISHRENNTVVVVDGHKYNLQEFLAFSPYLDRGIITEKILADDGPSLRSRVDIINKEAHRWTLSVLSGHGQVWWRSDEDPTPKTENFTHLTSEQLLKRRLHGFAFAPGTSLKGLASAGGIFKTEDGKTWQEIPQFAGQNYPVSIHPDGGWYVGGFRSYDEGKTFEPYIKWDRLAQQIQNSIHKTPRHLRITQIEPVPHSRIRILVDTGVQKIKMQAHVLSQEWMMVK